MTTNKSRNYLGLGLLLIAAIVVIAGISFNSQEVSSAPEANATYVNAIIKLETTGTVSPLRVEIAADGTAWQQGMMHRQQWGNIAGMLFVFDEEQPRSFWMKNTYLPMDIVFFDSGGQIANITENTTPLSEALIPSLLPTQYVLELPAGKVDELGINDATILHLDSFERALP